MDKTKKSFSRSAKTYNKDIFWHDNSAKKEYDLRGKEVYVIGDIHGCMYTLKNALKQVGLDLLALPENTILVSVGDIHDKGEYSVEVLEWAIKKCSEGSLIVVDSNHGRALTRKIENPRKRFKESVEYTYSQIRNSGGKPLASKIAEFLKSRPVYLDALTDNGRLVVAHACALERVIGNKKLSPAEVRYFMLARDAVWRSAGTCVVGHVRFPEPVISENQNGGRLVRLDTGCAEENGNLTILHLNSGKLYSTPVDQRDLTGYSSGSNVDELDDEEI